MSSNEAYKIIKKHTKNVRYFEYYNGKYLVDCEGDTPTFVLDENTGETYYEPLWFLIAPDHKDYLENVKRFQVNNDGLVELIGTGDKERLEEFLKYE